MLVTKPTHFDSNCAQAIYQEFRHKPGSMHIATEFALAHLVACVRAAKPQRVLELGAGIGTITKLLLNHDHRPETIVATEDHPGCLDALRQNLASTDRTGLHVVTSLDELLALDLPYDLAICDGGFDTPSQYKGVRNGTTLFFEGSRGRHRRMLLSYLEQRGLRFEAKKMPRPGYKIYLKTMPDAPPGAWRRPTIKRRKGCWIGSAARSGT